MGGYGPFSPLLLATPMYWTDLDEVSTRVTIAWSHKIEDKVFGQSMYHVAYKSKLEFKLITSFTCNKNALSFSAGCLRNLLPGSAPISLQWFRLYVSFSNICKATTVTHTKRIYRNLLRKETSFVYYTSSVLRKAQGGFCYFKDIYVLESSWLIAGHLHFDKRLQFCFMEDFDTDYIFKYSVKIRLTLRHSNDTRGSQKSHAKQCKILRSIHTKIYPLFFHKIVLQFCQSCKYFSLLPLHQIFIVFIGIRRIFPG